MCSEELGSGDVLDDVAALVAERNRVDARLARAVRSAENQQAPERDGQESMASWLRGHCRLSPAEASRLVRNGRALEHLPALAEAHEAGLVSAEQVAVAARAVTPERLASALEQGVDLAVIDAVLTGVAVEREYADLVQVVQHYCDDLDPDGPEPDPTEGRSLTLARHADGSLTIRGHLDAVGGERLQTALEAHVQADRLAGDERTRAQRLGGRAGATVRQRAGGREPAAAARARAARGGADRQPDGRWRTCRPDGTEITIRWPLLAPAA
ncbi:DUF222 domain-containing protein [Geodermatophilus sp. SYSU D00525]